MQDLSAVHYVFLCVKSVYTEMASPPLCAVNRFEMLQPKANSPAAADESGWPAFLGLLECYSNTVSLGTNVTLFFSLPVHYCSAHFYHCQHKEVIFTDVRNKFMSSYPIAFTKLPVVLQNKGVTNQIFLPKSHKRRD